MTSENNLGNYSVKPFLDKINLIFNSILALPLVVFGWLYLEAKAGRVTSYLTGENVNVINFLLPFLILAIVVASFVFFKRKIREISRELTLSIILDNYLKVALQKYVGLTVALVLSVVGYFLTQSNTMVVMFVIVLVFFSLNKPSAMRIANNLNLKGKERDVMMNKEPKAQDIEK